MKKVQKPYIMLKENIDLDDYNLINGLQRLCINEDQTALKLELDYKLGASAEEEKGLGIKNINEFMYFDKQQLIGYIGICGFGSLAPIEVNGMVHPEYRGQGVFKTLNALVMAEWKRRSSGSMLLLCDRKSSSGQQFIQGTGAQYKHTEYEMYLKKEDSQTLKGQMHDITFRKATNADAGEIARQNAIYFGQIFGSPSDKQASGESQDTLIEEPLQNEELILPEEEERRGMTIYLAEWNQQIIGKIHLQLTSEIGAIYGLGVLPEYRGRGFGRAILKLAIEKLKDANADEIMLQVEANNANALNLYKSSGFIATSIMDYFELKR